MSADQLPLVTEHLRQVMKCADAACDAAFHVPDCRAEPINWGDFACVSADLFVTDEGEHGIRVWIEEAAPNCFNTRQFVKYFLERHGFRGVEVVTAW